MQSTIVTDASYTKTVSLSAAKQHLGIGTNGFDSQVEIALAAAIDWCERYTGRTLRPELTRRDTFRTWSEVCQPFDYLPITSIVSVEYYNTSGDLQTVDAANYRLLASTHGVAKLELAANYNPPQVFDRGDAIRREYKTGYASTAEIPPAGIQGILSMLLIFYGDLSQLELFRHEAAAKNTLAPICQGVYQ